MKKTPKQKKTNILAVDLPPETLEAVKKIAEERGLSVESFVSNLVDARYGKPPEVLAPTLTKDPPIPLTEVVPAPKAAPPPPTPQPLVETKPKQAVVSTPLILHPCYWYKTVGAGGTCNAQANKPCYFNGMACQSCRQFTPLKRGL